MSTTALPTLTPAAAEMPEVRQRDDIPTAPIWRLTVHDYHAMIDASILKSGDLVELLDGWLVKKMTKYPRHSAANYKVNSQLVAGSPSGWYVRNQEPISLKNSESEPEPDVAIVRGTVEDYLEKHPGAADVAVVVEVSESSLDQDRTIKKRVYAAENIPVYWIVNLVDGQVEVFHDPSGPSDSPTYANEQIYKPGDEIALEIDGRDVGMIAVSELLP